MRTSRSFIACVVQSYGTVFRRIVNNVTVSNLLNKKLNTCLLHRAFDSKPVAKRFEIFGLEALYKLFYILITIQAYLLQYRPETVFPSLILILCCTIESGGNYVESRPSVQPILYTLWYNRSSKNVKKVYKSSLKLKLTHRFLENENNEYQ